MNANLIYEVHPKYHNKINGEFVHDKVIENEAGDEWELLFVAGPNRSTGLTFFAV